MASLFWQKRPRKDCSLLIIWGMWCGFLLKIFLERLSVCLFAGAGAKQIIERMRSIDFYLFSVEGPNNFFAPHPQLNKGRPLILQGCDLWVIIAYCKMLLGVQPDWQEKMTVLGSNAKERPHVWVHSEEADVNESCHAKTYLSTIVIVIPSLPAQESGSCPPILLLVWQPLRTLRSKGRF